MPFIYEVVRTEDDEVLTTISHPFDEDEPKTKAEEMASKLHQNKGIKCEVRKIN